jgi:hypothetical protein
MKKLITKIQSFIFGVRVSGEKITEISNKFPLREMNIEDYNQWCQQIKFGSQYYR